MRKSILFIGGNFAPEQTGIGKYSGEMIAWMAEQGFDCAVITTFPYYPHWKVQAPYHRRRYWYKVERPIGSENGSIRVIRCPHYVPGTPSGFKRILSDLSFLFSAFFVILIMLFKRKYQLVFTVTPPFCLGLLAAFYRKVKGSKFVYHIQDLQIEVAQSLKIIKSRRLLDSLRNLEKFILQHADYISSISSGMIAKIKAKTLRPVVYLPNWVDTEKFYPVEDKDLHKAKFDIREDTKVILYSGAIGEKQGLENILHSAKFFHNVSDWLFVICGCGPYKEKLVSLKNKMKLTNVKFLPIQPLENLNELLNIAEVHLVLQKKGAVNLTMPSKLGTIFSVGGASVVAAERNSCLHKLIESELAGVLIDPENQQELNEAIFNTMNADNREIKANARAFAENHLSIDKILSSFVNSIYTPTEVFNLANIKPNFVTAE